MLGGCAADAAKMRVRVTVHKRLCYQLNTYTDSGQPLEYEMPNYLPLRLGAPGQESVQL